MDVFSDYKIGILTMDLTMKQKVPEFNVNMPLPGAMSIFSNITIIVYL